MVAIMVILPLFTNSMIEEGLVSSVFFRVILNVIPVLDFLLPPFIKVSMAFIF